MCMILIYARRGSKIGSLLELPLQIPQTYAQKITIAENAAHVLAAKLDGSQNARMEQALNDAVSEDWRYTS